MIKKNIIMYRTLFFLLMNSTELLFAANTEPIKKAVQNIERQKLIDKLSPSFSKPPAANKQVKDEVAPSFLTPSEPNDPVKADRSKIQKELQRLREQDPLHLLQELQNLGEKILNSGLVQEKDLAQAKRLVSHIGSIEDRENKRLGMDRQAEILRSYMSLAERRPRAKNMAAVIHCTLAGQGLSKEAEAIRAELLLVWDARVAFLRKKNCEYDTSALSKKIEKSVQNSVNNIGAKLFQLNTETELFEYIDKKFAGQEFP